PGLEPKYGLSTNVREPHDLSMPAAIEDYGLIGDATTVALISRQGSIDWLCLPRIDSDACFAKLLGTDEHGYWTVGPATAVRGIERHYRRDTLILEREITTDGGRARLIDFMPPGETQHDIIRIVEGIEGEVAMHVGLKVRFGYGKHVPWIKADGNRATL